MHKFLTIEKVLLIDEKFWAYCGNPENIDLTTIRAIANMIGVSTEEISHFCELFRIAKLFKLLGLSPRWILPSLRQIIDESHNPNILGNWVEKRFF